MIFVLNSKIIKYEEYWAYLDGSDFEGEISKISELTIRDWFKYHILEKLPL